MSIGRSNLDGTGANQQFIGVGQGAADYLAVDDRYLYWSNGAEIGRANLDGSDVIPGFINLRGDDVGGLAVDSSHIYWADRTHGTIGRANLDGSGVNSSFITGATNATDVAVDGQYVYWTQIATSGLPPAGSIGRANLDGSGANSSFITGAAEPFGITVDYDHIYWTNYYNCDNQTQPPSGCAGGTIGRANLDGSAVNQAYITADEDTGPGCNTDPQTRCGPSTVAVSAADPAALHANVDNPGSSARRRGVRAATRSEQLRRERGRDPRRRQLDWTQFLQRYRSGIGCGDDASHFDLGRGGCRRAVTRPAGRPLLRLGSSGRRTRGSRSGAVSRAV